ncbi:Rv3654c family TadE-like protein [Streptomyces sp. NPDC047737]|uniref:Rv3654c family TadE-like protein n=1 Tax=Streptomyces sp. NPDC047737 TaxID=3155740 RepID=UPI0033C4B583
MAGTGRDTDAGARPAGPDAGRRGGRVGRGHGGGGALIATRRGRVTDDQGLATVWVAVTTATLCAVFGVVLALGQAVSARHQAGGAADLAALAAADRALRGTEAACGTASEVARAQGAEVVRCAIQGEIADVTARVRFGPYAPEVRSRAGPPDAEAPGLPRSATSAVTRAGPVPGLPRSAIPASTRAGPVPGLPGSATPAVTRAGPVPVCPVPRYRRPRGRGQLGRTPARTGVPARSGELSVSPRPEGQLPPVWWVRF